MAKKVYSVNITLPDLSAAHAEQQIRVEAASWPRAVRIACEEICKRPHVLGKHIKSARIQLGLLENDARPAEKREPEPGGRRGRAQRERAQKERAPEDGFLFEL